MIRKVTDPAGGLAGVRLQPAAVPTARRCPARRRSSSRAASRSRRQVDAGTSVRGLEDQAVEAAHGYTLAAVGGDGCTVVGASVVVTPQAGGTVTCTFVSERDRPGLSVEAVARPPRPPATSSRRLHDQNTGNVPLHGVAVEDDTCAPVVGPADGAGEDGACCCRVSAGPSRAPPRRRGRRRVDGTVTATAKDPQGATVTATSRHTTTLGAPTPGTGDGAGPMPGDDGGATTPSPAGRPGPHPAGRARHAHLHGPTGCAVRDGPGSRPRPSDRPRRVPPRRAPRGDGAPRRPPRPLERPASSRPALRRGAHRLTATVTFTAGGGARTRTLSSSFSRCRAFSVRPGATG